ncbi:MAG: hypothetical protein ABI811_12375 [Acidobacteriota bacterium]
MLFLLLAVQASAQISKEAVQIHGFFSQGYAISDHNNYLTMDTSRGTAQMTDGGLNLTWRVNNKLRVGVQAYDRYIGELGKGRVSLDWAQVDYRLRDWLGFRAGKVKTALGLFTDSQDEEFLYPWALLPQSVYPLDLREIAYAHIGFDLYGVIGLRRFGSVSYTAYGGKVPADSRSGLVYGLEDSGFSNVTYSGRTTGYDARWSTPVKGLTAGLSQSFGQRDYSGEIDGAATKATAKTYMSRQTALYLEFVRGRWRVDGEYRAWKSLTRAWGVPTRLQQSGQVSPSWFTALSFRITPRIEVGAYRSQYRYSPVFHAVSLPTGDGANYVDDTTVTIRFDPARYWNIKLEGHFIDGFGNALSARGFYPRYHPQGMQPTTNMLVVRTGFNF